MTHAQKADNKNSEQENTGMLDDNSNPPSDPAASLDKALLNTKPVTSKIDARLIGDFNLFSTQTWIAMITRFMENKTSI